MKRVFLAAAVTALATAAHADALSVFFGNTLSITSDGKTSKAFINQDGTYENDLADGTVIKGTYVSKDGSTCYMQTTPAPAAGSAPLCVKDQDHKVVDSWTDTVAGKPTTMTLTAGR